MKLLTSDGRRLRVWDLGRVLVEFEAGAVPLKHCGAHVMEDDAARAVVREVIAAGCYRRVDVKAKGDER